MLPCPFTGISGVHLVRHARAILGSVSENASRSVGCGVLADSKTIFSESRGDGRTDILYPSTRNISKLFLNHPLALNILKFSSDYSECNKITSLINELQFLISHCGRFLHAVQFNFLPHPTVLHVLKESAPTHYNFVLIAQQVMKLHGSPQALARHLQNEYGKDLDGVVFEYNPNVIGILEPYLQIYNDPQWNLPLNVILTGNFDPTNLEQVAPILRRYPKTSLDSLQEVLEREQLNVERACELIRQVQLLFSGEPTPDPTKPKTVNPMKLVAA